MENIEQEKQNIGETLEPLDNGDKLPIIIEKPKRKRRETQSPAQIESLRKGREILQENRKKKREEKKQGVSTDPNYMKEISDKFDTMLRTIEDKFNHTASPEPIHLERTPSPVYTPPVPRKFFV